MCAAGAESVPAPDRRYRPPMSAGGLPAAVAIAGGLVLAVALFVPFAAVTYRREGALGVGDLAALVAVPVYGLALWTYTLLPLPDRDDLTCRPAQTHVLAAVDDVRANGTATLAELAHNPALLQVVLNVALFVPLGVLLRWRWRRGLPTAVVVGFAVSLLIELTQLTGIWGVYPCAYRLFDVDDLIANTAGAALGWLVATAVAPHRHAERRAVPRMTFGRRLVAMVSDGLVVVLGAFVRVARVAGLAARGAQRVPGRRRHHVAGVDGLGRAGARAGGDRARDRPDRGRGGRRARHRSPRHGHPAGPGAQAGGRRGDVHRAGGVARRVGARRPARVRGAGGRGGGGHPTATAGSPTRSPASIRCSPTPRTGAGATTGAAEPPDDDRDHAPPARSG